VADVEPRGSARKKSPHVTVPSVPPQPTPRPAYSESKLSKQTALERSTRRAQCHGCLIRQAEMPMRAPRLPRRAQRYRPRAAASTTPLRTSHRSAPAPQQTAGRRRKTGDRQQFPRYQPASPLFFATAPATQEEKKSHGGACGSAAPKKKVKSRKLSLKKSTRQ